MSVNELKDPYFSLQFNKCSGYDDISFNVVRNCFGPLLKPLTHIFNLSLEKRTFSDDLNIAQVTPVFIAVDDSEIGNFRLISVLPCFSKKLERIMYNRLFKYLTANEVLYKKQFGFRAVNSAEHAIMKLIDLIKK